MSLLYDKVVNIILKPPNERKDAEIEQILPWFRKKSDLFQSLHTDIVRDIVKNCKFMNIQRDTVIIRQMDKGDCFYVILSGQVSIHINTTLTEEEYEEVKLTQEAEEAATAKDPKKSLDRSKYGIYVGKIDAGKSFGELALINADCVRNATIIADESTDLLSVDRDLYNRSLKSFQAQEFEQRRDFVKSFPLFSNWAPRYKKMMAYSLKKQVMNFEDIIVKQGTQVDGIHFIISGLVKIRVDPSQHENQYPQLYPLGVIAELEKAKARELLRKEMNLQRSRTAERKSMYQRKAVPQGDGTKPNLKPLELCIAGSVDVIGDLEMAMNLSTYSQTVECTEGSVIFHLDQRNYDRLIEKRNPVAFEMLKDIVHTKLTLHFSRLQEDSIPLYRYFLYTLDEKEKDARRNARMPRTRTPQEMEVNVDNLQKGPLVNMYGPGSVFYLIRKRAKEMEMRRRRRQNNRDGRIRFGVTPKATQTAYGFKTNRGFPSSYDHVDGHRPGSPTGSVISVYGAADDPSHIMHSLDQEFMDDSRRDFYGDGSDLDDDDEYQWEGSDPALSQLEERMSQWHQSLGTTVRGTCVVPLHRYQREETKPKPGNKVYVKVRKPRNVSFFAFQSSGDDSSSDGVPPKTSAQTSRSPISSMRLENSCITDKPIDVMSDIEERPKTPSASQRPNSSKSEPPGSAGHKQRKRKQYTVAEYQALKAELRRRQKAWIPLLSNRSATVL